jgi:hypothetical protein
MPKPMTMVIQVEETAFGRVFRLLDTMPGVASITLTGAGPKTKGPKKVGGPTVPMLILNALCAAKGGHMLTAELRPVVEAGGKKGTSVPDSLTKLGKLKLVTRKEGVITITALGRKHMEEKNGRH